MNSPSGLAENELDVNIDDEDKDEELNSSWYIRLDLPIVVMWCSHHLETERSKI